MQTLVVVLIVLIAVAYLGRRFYRSTRTKNACGCGCDGCGAVDACADIAEVPPSVGNSDIRCRTAGDIADETSNRKDRP
jgi:hypothetical protein